MNNDCSGEGQHQVIVILRSGQLSVVTSRLPARVGAVQYRKTKCKPELLSLTRDNLCQILDVCPVAFLHLYTCNLSSKINVLSSI
jgi:hypothetical protein